VEIRTRIPNDSSRRPAVENLESRLLLTAAALEGLTGYLTTGSVATTQPSTLTSTSIVDPNLAGDANLNGTVNFHDLQNLLGGFGNVGFWDQGNFNSKSTFDFNDLQLLLGNFSGSTTMSASETQSIENLVGEFGYTATPNANGTGFALASNTSGTRHLVFKTDTPADGTAGSAISPSIIVKIENAQNKVVTTATKTITLSVASGPSDTIHGTVSVAAVDGKATFSNVKLDTAGTYTLTASDDKDISATSGSFTIKHAAASQLVFASTIQLVGADTTITPPIVVDVEDAFGNLCTGSTIAVTLGLKDEGGVIPELASADATSDLQGTLKVHAVAGQATFSDISINTAGNCELKAKHGALTKGFSNIFVVGGLLT